jgi:DNA adenine methylase
MIKSPLRYPGGKSRAVQFLSSHIPPFKEFRDVFFGGGSLSFHLLQNHQGKTFTASDLNFDLYTFWSQLSIDPDTLIHGIQHVYDRYREKDGKKLFEQVCARRNKKLSPLQRAIDFYVLNRISFSGVVDSGGYSAAAFAGRFTQSAVDRLFQVAPLINQIELRHEDYASLLLSPGREVVIFLDPPYYSATRSKLYGRKGRLHTGFDHQLLFENLKKCRHKWLITYDNSDLIRDLYKDYDQLNWQLQYGMTNKVATSQNELLIANYDLRAVCEGQKQMDKLRLSA